MGHLGLIELYILFSIFPQQGAFFYCYCCDGKLEGTWPGWRSQGYDTGLKGLLRDSNNADTTTDAVDAPEYEQPEGTEEEASKNEGMGKNPSYSLAGSGAQNPNNNQGYTDEEYQKYASQYNKQDDGPTWSLAHPLPHIVRPGMRHGALPEDRKEDRKEDRDGTTENQQDSAHEEEVRKQQSSENRTKKVNDPKEDGFFNTWSKIRHQLREPLAEWLGVSFIDMAQKYNQSSSLLTSVSHRQLWQ